MPPSTDKKSGVSPSPRPAVQRMHAYVPGEQPQGSGFTKLNTNENPYPPSPKVLEALAGLGAESVRKYPSPVCSALRSAIASDFGVADDQVLVTNGSDEILKMAVEAFVDPGEGVGYLWPTYSLYPVFVAKHAAREVRLEWWKEKQTQEAALEQAPEQLRVLFIANPNPPIGLAVDLNVIRRVAESRPQCLVVIDEAYIAYGGDTAAGLVSEGFANILVTRTFSKSHSLAGLRAGFGLAHPEVMDALYRLKDSYNVNAATQAAALAAWLDKDHTGECVARIQATRARLLQGLRERGFQVEDSAGNFLFARHKGTADLFQLLKSHRILVRHFGTPELSDGLRITVGTEEETARLMACLDSVEAGGLPGS